MYGSARRTAAAEIAVASWQVTARLMFTIAGCIALPAALQAAVDDNQYDTPLYPAPPTDALSTEIPGPQMNTPQPDPKPPTPEVSFGTLLQRLDNNAVPKQPGYSTGDSTKSFSTNPGSTTLDTTHSFTTGVKPPGF
jgi:hypothetical protein